MNPRVNGTGLAAKTLVTLRKEGVRGMGAAWGWLCRSGGGENFVVVGCGRRRVVTRLGWLRWNGRFGVGFLS